MTPIKRIAVEHLAIGMYVTKGTGGLEDGKMLAQGFIYRQETIDKIRAKGINNILIDTQRGDDSPHALPLTNPPAASKRKSLNKERENADKVYSEATELVSNLLNDVKLGKAIDVTPVEGLADEINNSVLNNPNALLCLSQIREKDKYLLEHSVNVGILMGIFSRHLGYKPNEVHQLVTGALLHDIGKVRVPNEILHKPGKLTEEEWEEMRRHVNYGVDVLKKSKGISKIALSICAQHHERLDGGGYPLGLANEKISAYGRLASIVDIYDAVTAKRVYHDGMPPADAMRLLLKLSLDQLDSKLVYQFIRCMSVYPVGSLVELTNGRLGVVREVNQEDSTRPRVKIIFNARHNHHESPKEIDLSKADPDLKIVSAVSPDIYGIHINDFL